MPIEESGEAGYEFSMKLFIGFVLWCILLALSWPVAILALVMFPLVWLALLPIRLILLLVRAIFGLLAAILFLPARLLGARP